jgi:predicted nucleic acid-binding protein
VKALFVDTAGWMMLADGADPAHGSAKNVRDQWLEKEGILVSTDYVLDETLSLLRFRLGLGAAETWWKSVELSPRIVWEWIDPARCEKARAWLFRWEDKGFSHTDCTSFVVMRERRIRAALTSDKHFVQAGFERRP